MKKETREMFRDLSFYSSLGLTVGLSVAIGFAFGFYLDRKFDTDPWLKLVGLILGIAAAYRNIWLALKKSRNL